VNKICIHEWEITGQENYWDDWDSITFPIECKKCGKEGTACRKTLVYCEDEDGEEETFDFQTGEIRE